MDIVTVFCEIDDFCQYFEPEWKKSLLANSEKQRDRKTTLCLSEIMTIIVWFHSSGYRTFKDYYKEQVMKHYKWAFPKLVSYNRFVELMQTAIVPLCCYLDTRKGISKGIAFIDSLPLAVCHNRRIYSNKVFTDIAERSKSSMGWFYGFKLHLVVNDIGEIVSLRLTVGNVDDREVVPVLTKGITGKLFGDRGYISQKLFKSLFEGGLQLITKPRATKKMKQQKLLPLFDKMMLRKRSIIETVNDQLQNISQIEHSRHRSLANFFVNIIAALIAYSFRDKLPSLNIRDFDITNLPAIL
jgi:hypothetical protein